MAKKKEGRLKYSNGYTRESLPDMFNQGVLCKFLGKSTAWAERCRWQGTGPPYLKIGSEIRYQKDKIIKYLKDNQKGEGIG